MLFTETRFLLFLGALLTLFWLLRANTGRKLLLLLASYAFYAAWDWRFLSLILISTAVDFAVGQALERSQSPRGRRLLLGVSLVVNLGLLGFFKYFGFFTESLRDLARVLGQELSQPTLEIVLPVGISFYTFQTLSYTIDVFRRQLEPTRNLLDFALFVAFFPQLVAGPIVRAREFLPQLSEATTWSRVDVRWAVHLFLLGYFKKAVLSDNVAPWVDAFYLSPASFDALSAWLATSLYSLQIYCDFSGYSDMAIASAALFGYRLRDNFDAPYLARNIAAFWRRWHMSLSSWLRDYLYISLGGNRAGALRTQVNLMITMGLGGLWHGASWNFVLWGVLHGLALVVHRQLSDKVRVPSWLAVSFTLLFVQIVWIPFRSPDLTSTTTAITALFGSGDGSRAFAIEQVAILGLLAVAGLAAQAWYRASQRTPMWRQLPAPLFAFSSGALLVLLLSLTPVGTRPFIYFQF